MKGPENKPGQFDVHAVMSPGHKVKTFTVNPPLKTRDLDLVEPSTALVAMLNGTTPLGRHRSGSKKKHPEHGRPMHAEDKLLKYLRAAWSVQPLKPAGQENRVVVSITRTPCEACSNEFLKFEAEKKAEGHVVEFDIAAMSLYRATKATIAQFEIMKVLRSKGHTLTAWNVLNDLTEVLGED